LLLLLQQLGPGQPDVGAAKKIGSARAASANRCRPAPPTDRAET